MILFISRYEAQPVEISAVAKSAVIPSIPRDIKKVPELDFEGEPVTNAIRARNPLLLLDYNVSVNSELDTLLYKSVS